jgi:hypothetical protein
MAFIFVPRGENVFEVGSKVSYRGMDMPAEVISGPHRSPGRSRYLIKKADDNVSLVSEADLKRVIPREEQVANAIAVQVYGRGLSTLPVGYRYAATRAAIQAIAVADETRGRK